MEAHLTSPTSSGVASTEESLLQIARQTITLGATLVLLLGAVVVTRGLLGALEAPDSAIFLVLTAASAAVLASLFRVAWLRLYPDAPCRSRRFVLLGIPSTSVICIAVALSMAGTSSWTVGFLWLFIVGSELAWWYPEVRTARRRSTEQLTPVATDFEYQQTGAADESAGDEELAANVIQQMTRSRTDDGVEVISGVLRAAFAPGERIHNLHVAFCPPLEYEPKVIAHQLDGPPLDIKVAQSEIFGTRLKLRLATAVGASESATIYFEVQPR